MSGGMNQRVMIAMAIACNPRLLIADEPTTALDVTIQAQILDLLRNLQKERGMALVLITHNMGVVSEMARRVAVMYAGQVIEQRTVAAAVRRSAAPLHRGAAVGAARAQDGRPSRWPTFPASCPACWTGPGCLFAPRCDYATAYSQGSAAGSCATGRAAWCAATTRWAIRSATGERVPQRDERRGGRCAGWRDA